jgi:hypothetical protein
MACQSWRRLTVATVVLEQAGGVNWAACFHAQQATEKALKALLVALGIDFPRSHALERLLALLPAHIARSSTLRLSPNSHRGPSLAVTPRTSRTQISTPLATSSSQREPCSTEQRASSSALRNDHRRGQCSASQPMKAVPTEPRLGADAAKRPGRPPQPMWQGRRRDTALAKGS